MAFAHVYFGEDFEISKAEDGFGTKEQKNPAIRLLGDGTLSQAGWQVTKKISIKGVDTDEEIYSGFLLPQSGMVLDVWVNVRVPESTGMTKTLSVGLEYNAPGGNALGFLKWVNVSTVGVKLGSPIITQGANIAFFSGTTRGEFLVDFFAGNDVASYAGIHNEKPHILNGLARQLTYTFGSSGFADLEADIYVKYIDLDE